jgi:hypothetical protein
LEERNGNWRKTESDVLEGGGGETLRGSRYIYTSKGRMMGDKI